MKYTVHQAKTNLSRLLAEASAGKDVVIASWRRAGRKSGSYRCFSQKALAGSISAKISAAPDAFGPLTDQELKDLGFAHESFGGYSGSILVVQRTGKIVGSRELDDSSSMIHDGSNTVCISAATA